MAEFDNSLRTWLAENLINGCTHEVLKTTLLGAGISEKEIEKEISLAEASPYLAAGAKIHNVLQRRESLLKTLDKWQRNLDEYTNVKKVPLPPFKDFLRDYYYRNRIGHFSGGADHWPAMKWTPRNLVDKVGADTLVEVQIGREDDNDFEANRDKYRRKVKFGDFVNWVETTESSNDFYMTANNQAMAAEEMKVLLDDIKNIGDGYFNQESNLPYLWIGPKGTITPLHQDLSNNFFVQVHGTKTFRLIPAMQVPYVYNHKYVYSEVDLLNYDLAQYPNLAKTTIIELKVEPGDCVFIPGGCWHHVVGETKNISLTFVNFNTPNNFVDYPSGGSRY